MKKIGLLFVLLPFSLLAIAQGGLTGSSTTPVRPGAASGVRAITLGNPSVVLDGSWKFAAGDSPWVNGSPVWAQPGYDDSAWATMEVTPAPGLSDPEFDRSDFVRGWTRKGYPNLDGFAWYRLRVHVTDPGLPMGLQMPVDFDDGYQVFANGKYVGECGRFGSNHVELYFSHPVSVPLPQPGPDGDIVLAVRFYLSPSTRFFYADVGGMHQPPVLGAAAAVGLLQSLNWIHSRAISAGLLLAILPLLLLAPMALWAWLRNRGDRMYLWLFLASVCTIAANLSEVIAEYTYLLSYAVALCMRDLSFLIMPLWIMFWWHWFGLERKRWIPRAAWLVTIVGVLAELCTLSPLIGFSFVPLPWLHWFNSATQLLTAALGMLLVILLVEGFRRDRAEAVLAVVPILLVEFASFAYILMPAFDLPARAFPFGLGFTAGDVGMITMALVVGLVALRRFVRTQVRQEVERRAISQDLEQAQQLQQRVLIPEAIRSTAFRVETEYRPAQAVGGDFFQTLMRADGTLIVVIGDVSGKGVSAAMLVAVLVGAIRTRADESFDPASMLVMLNHRLLGRSGGHFATCLAAEIKPEGRMRIANAGHLPPYLNGKEMELEGSLPLGISKEAEYPAQEFDLAAGDRLTFMTDGVVEATRRSKDGAIEMFGFERTRKISAERAAAIAEQAQNFGQEDDITVVGVEFAGAVEGSTSRVASEGRESITATDAIGNLA